MTALGDVLGGKFRIDRAIGEGAMGVVYEATDVSIDRRVAVKVLAGYLSADPAHRQRFLHEARVVAKLRSPHVVHVFEVGEAPDATPFYVMEYLEGRSVMRAILEDGPMPVPRAVTIVLQVLDALAEAHAAGLVHRDVKPDNLLLTKQGPVKVLDFGIVKDLASTSAPRTQTGDTMGTPAYMAPEQVRAGEPVDARTDIWAVGATLYEMLTGAIPFDGDGIPRILHGILNEPPKPIAAHRGDVPADLDAIVARCLAKKKDDRWPTARALTDALAPFAPLTAQLPRAAPTSAPAAAAASAAASASAPAFAPAAVTAPAPVRAGPNKPLLFAAAFLLAVIGGGVVLAIALVAMPRPPAPPPPTAPAPPPSAIAPPPTTSSSAPPPAPSKAIPATPRSPARTILLREIAGMNIECATAWYTANEAALGACSKVRPHCAVVVNIRFTPSQQPRLNRAVLGGLPGKLPVCTATLVPEPVDCVERVVASSPPSCPDTNGKITLTWTEP